MFTRVPSTGVVEAAVVIGAAVIAAVVVASATAHTLEMIKFIARFALLAICWTLTRHMIFPQFLQFVIRVPVDGGSSTC